MIEITKGNPTPEEIAALVAVLTLARRTTQPLLTSSRADEWRRSTPFAEVNPAEHNRRDRRWRTRTTGVTLSHAVWRADIHTGYRTCASQTTACHG